MDRFLWMGPSSNPAKVNGNDTTQEAIRKIMRTEGAVWLTRVDDSTISNKESHVVATVVADIRASCGLPVLSTRQILNSLIIEGYSSLPEAYRMPLEQFKSLPAFEEISWEESANIVAQTNSHNRLSEYRKQVSFGFYRPIKVLPKEATIIAAQLEYYTMSDHGIWNSISFDEKQSAQILLDGFSSQETFFLNPAYALRGMGENPLADEFFEFLNNRQNMEEIVPKFLGRLGGNTKPLYEAPMEKYIHQPGKSLEEFVDSIPSIYAFS